MAVIIALSISILVVAFIAAPFFLFPGRRVSAEEQVPEGLRDLLAEKETLYAAIQELDFDLKSGKLSDKDHRALRERHEARAAALLQQIDALEGRARPEPRTARREKRKA
ncbi:MAG: hypothetical protein ACE147_08390 [Candidatus Methylomirabilales bacterium]